MWRTLSKPTEQKISDEELLRLMKDYGTPFFSKIIQEYIDKKKPLDTPEKK